MLPIAAILLEIPAAVRQFLIAMGVRERNDFARGDERERHC
jgi:hypothetical protein